MRTKAKKQTRKATRIAVVVATLAAAVYSLVPTDYVPEPVRALGSMLHPLSYAVLTFVYLISVVWDPWTGPRRWPNAAPLVIASVVAVGVILEIGQLFTSRGTNLGDVIGNLIGVTVASLTWASIRRRSDRSDQRAGEGSRGVRG